MGLISSGITNIGMKRKTNQDSIYMNRERNFFVVADGMGGHNGGDIASAIAVKIAPEKLYASIDSDNPVQKSLHTCINAANRAIYEKGQSDKSLEGMGTTVVSFYFSGNFVYIGNVGDSRAYLVNDHSLYQLSKDHSFVQEKLSLGLYTRQDAAKDPHKNVLSRTVGYEPYVQSEVFSYKVHRNDILFICSDGLHGKISDEDLCFLVNQNIPDPSVCTQEQLDGLTQAFIEQANANGGNDNISVIVVIAQ
ncbi:MAG: Stp1/IreP family PP2C-type Ser/Thr phosphatase [Bacteriovoracaceae bacterium]|nr:Stp1/IreP family PP2C-type Ser/Thr phosphatase [Bacteriovoracaceae bacterium]